MLDIANTIMSIVQNGEKNIAILPVEGLLHSGYFQQEGVTFIHPDSFENIEPLLAAAGSHVSENIASEFAMLFTPQTNEVFIENSLAIFVFDKDEFDFDTKNHYEDMDLINSISNRVSNALNTIRFIHCRLNAPGTLPFIPGQWRNSNGFMAALLVNYETPRIVCSKMDGAAMVTGLGLGLELDSSERKLMTHHPYLRLLNPKNPKIGEVGRVTRKALCLLNKALYANDETLKFIILMALFEYIATKDAQGGFSKAKTHLIPHLVKNKKEYHKLAERFRELSGKKDADGNELGYRSKIVHGGFSIDEILPSSKAREKLFGELFSYHERIIQDMIEDSYISFEALQEKRRQMRTSMGI